MRCIKVLLAGGVDIALVVTHEDSPTENLWFESVASLCQAEGIPYITPADARAPELLAQVQAARPDMLFSFYYRHMLPASILAVAPAYNMHGSLLPQFRGRAPVNWAVLHGAPQTGATLHEMTVKPDAGAIVAQTAVPILPDDTAFEVFGKVTVAAEQTLWRVLPALLDGTAPRQLNDLRQGGYFGGRKPEDGRIDWTVTGAAGLQPAPGRRAALSRRVHRSQQCHLHHRNSPFKHSMSAGSLPPGLAVVDNCIFGVCGDGRMLAISALRAAGEPISAQQLQASLTTRVSTH